MRTTLVSVLLVAALLGAGCGDDDAEVDAGPGDQPVTVVPDRPADLVGTITAVTPFEPEDCVPNEEADPDGATSSEDSRFAPFCADPDSDVLGTVLVEADPDSPSGDKISFTVTEATLVGWIYTGTDDPELFESSFASLREGERVDAWHDGGVDESFPAQATAVALLTEDPGS